MIGAYCHIIWRASSYSDDVYQCQYSGACKKGECAEGHEGVACRVCKNDYHHDALKNRCVECKGTSLDPLTIASGACLVALVLAIIVVACRSGGKEALLHAKGMAKGGVQGHVEGQVTDAVTDKVDKVLGDVHDAILGDDEEDDVPETERRGATTSDDATSTGQEGNGSTWAETRCSLHTKFKIILGVYQIQDALPWTIPTVSFPKAFEALIAWTSFLEFNVVQILPVSCLRPFNFFDKLFAMTALPIVFSLLIFFFGELAAMCATAKKAKSIRTTYFGAFLLLTFVVFPSVSTTVLRFYNCVSYEEGFSDGSTETIKVLEADHDISCTSPSYKGIWSTYALAMLFVYPVGIPLLYWVLLFRYRKQLDPDVDVSRLSEIEDTSDGRPRSASAEAYMKLNARLTRQTSSARDLMKTMLGANAISSAEVQELKLAAREADDSIQHLAFLFEEREPPSRVHRT